MPGAITSGINGWCRDTLGADPVACDDNGGGMTGVKNYAGG